MSDRTHGYVRQMDNNTNTNNNNDNNKLLLLSRRPEMKDSKSILPITGVPITMLYYVFLFSVVAFFINIRVFNLRQIKFGLVILFTG